MFPRQFAISKCITLDPALGETLTRRRLRSRHPKSHEGFFRRMMIDHVFKANVFEAATTLFEEIPEPRSCALISL